MKPALIATIMLAVIICLAPWSKAEQKSPNVTDYAQNNNRPAVPPFADSEKAKSGDQASDGQSPGGDSPAQWILVIITGITAAFICWQAWETRKAAKASANSVEAINKQAGIMERQTTATEWAANAATKSADAALLNAQAVINAERAWIVVDVESSEPNKFNFRATNVGKTPAKIKSIWSCPITFWRDSKLEIPPDEKTGESLLSTPPCLLPPTASQIVLRCNMGELGTGQYIGPDASARVQNDIQKGFRMLNFYGRIIYSDTLDEKSLHETKWLYWYLAVGEGAVIPDPLHPEWNSYS